MANLRNINFMFHGNDMAEAVIDGVNAHASSTCSDTIWLDGTCNMLPHSHLSV
jgi:hypothetical protein